MSRPRQSGAETGIREEVVELRDRQAQPVEYRAALRPRRIDPVSLPTMPYKPVATRVRHPVPPMESDFWKREQ